MLRAEFPHVFPHHAKTMWFFSFEYENLGTPFLHIVKISQYLDHLESEGRCDNPRKTDVG